MSVPTNATLERLPRYLAYLKIKRKQDIQTISSTRIAEDLRLNPVLVRKDLALACQAGRPKTGYPMDVLIMDLESFLGCHNIHDAFLVGAGRLGRALMACSLLHEYGLSILAAFDISTTLVGQELDGKPVLPMHKLPDLLQRMGVQIAIVTVPAKAAQPVCNLLVDSGVRAIWNFTAVPLEVPERIIVQHENIASSFTVLSKRLGAAFESEKKREDMAHEHNDWEI